MGAVIFHLPSTMRASAEHDAVTPVPGPSPCMHALPEHDARRAGGGVDLRNAQEWPTSSPSQEYLVRCHARRQGINVPPRDHDVLGERAVVGRGADEAHLSAEVGLAPHAPLALPAHAPGVHRDLRTGMTASRAYHRITCSDQQPVSNGAKLKSSDGAKFKSNPRHVWDSM